MNKLLKVSLIAMLAVGPVSAFADIQSIPAKYIAADDSMVTDNPGTAAVASTDIASTGYVKGAYNAAVTAINDLNTIVETKQDALKAGSGANAAGMDTVVAQSVDSAANASTTKLVSESAVRSAIDSAISGRVSASDMAGFAGQGLTWDSANTEFDVKLQSASGLSVDSTGLKADVRSVVDGDTNGTIKVNGSAITVYDDTSINNTLGTKLDSSLASVATNGHYIQSGTNVATNLGKLDSAIHDVANAGYQTSSNVQSAITGRITSSFDPTDTTKALNGVAVNTAISTKLDSSSANVSSAGHYIQSGTGVATNLGKLDSALNSVSSRVGALETAGYQTSSDVQGLINGAITSTYSASDATHAMNGVAVNTAITNAITNTYSATNSTQAVTGSAVASALASFATTNNIANLATKTQVKNAIDSSTVTVRTTWGSTATGLASNVMTSPTIQ